MRPDHYAMGRLAAEHLLERGLRRLAYYGLKGFWFTELRGQGFIDAAKEAGATCDVFLAPRISGRWISLQKRTDLLSDWLRRLHPPVGLLAVQDYRARAVIEECDRLGLHVPHDVAVVGMENDPAICEFCLPTLTSVERNSWLLGYETAKTLDRLMNGLTVPMGKPFGIDQVVRATPISRRQLEISFWRVTGITPLEYRQVERAKDS